METFLKLTINGLFMCICTLEYFLIISIIVTSHINLTSIYFREDLEKLGKRYESDFLMFGYRIEDDF